MGKFILKRLLLMIPILLGVAFIIFSIMSLTPGDPGTLLLGMDAEPEAIRALNEKLGYYDPFFVKFFDYLKGVLVGDFGTSYRTGYPVFEEIFPKLPATITLVLFANAISLLIGIPLGILSAVKQYSLADILTTAFSLLLASIPAFWLGFMAILTFSLKLKYLPSSGIDSWKGFIMPCAIMGLAGAAGLARLVRSMMLEVIRQDYIRTARAKGVYERFVIFKHALRNALIPIVTVVGMGFARGLGGSLIIETVFGISGIGTAMIIAITTKDIPVAMAGVLMLASIFSVTNLLVDITYGFLDPRIKSQYAKRQVKV